MSHTTEPESTLANEVIHQFEHPTLVGNDPNPHLLCASMATYTDFETFTSSSKYGEAVLWKS